MVEREASSAAFIGAIGPSEGEPQDEHDKTVTWHRERADAFRTARDERLVRLAALALEGADNDRR
jgi:hypothetical protein